jgi:hypothetical protein
MLPVKMKIRNNWRNRSLYLTSVKALKLVNNAMTSHQDITSPCVYIATPASFRGDSTLVLITAPTHWNVDYKDYLAIVKDAPKGLKPKEATLTSRITKFLVHGIPTFYTPDEVRKDIEIANPSVQHPIFTFSNVSEALLG